MKIIIKIQRFFGLLIANMKRMKHTHVLIAQQQIQNLKNELKQKDATRLELFAYKVYSQNDEDGMIQEIFKRIGTTNKTFIEIGVGDGLENNTYFLLFKGWNGTWIEGSPKQAKSIRKNFATLFNNKQLSLIQQYVDKDNISKILIENTIAKNIDLFSVDIDGNDFYVLESALKTINPRVIIAEYNAKFPADVDWCMKYNPAHRWQGSDNVGVALKTLTEMLQTKGYSLVGTNITGVNAFFVRKDSLQNLFPYADNIAELYNTARYSMGAAFQVYGHPAREAIC